MNKSFVWTIVTVLLLLALSVVALLLIKPLNIHDQTKIPDSYIKNFSDRVYSQDGTLTCLINSPRLIHYRQNDASYLQTPTITILSHGDVWHITAQHGKSTNNNSIITLWGNVIVNTKGSKQQTATRLTTTTMTIYPARSQATSTAAVTITQPHDIIQGTGFTANFKTGIFKLLRQARGRYDENS